MKNQFMAVVVMAGLAGSTVGAAPLAVQQVDSSSRWVMHLDAEKLWTTELGTLLKQELATSPAKAKLDAVALIFGLDPLKDIRGLTLYGQEPGRQQGVMLVDGNNLDQERILTLLRAAPEYSSVTRPDGSVLHHWIDVNAPKNDHAAGSRWGAFHGRNLIVVGNSQQQVGTALDVLNGKQTALKPGATLGGYPLDGKGAILVGAAAMPEAPVQSAAQPGEPPNQSAMIMQNAEGLSMRLEEQAGGILNLTVMLRAKNPETAAFVEQALKGIQAIGALSQGKRPALAKLAQSVTIVATGNDVKAQLAYGAQDLVTLYQSMKHAPRHEPPAPAAAADASEAAPL
ncbi:MAG: hypothetical protein WC708_16000 [Lentisphaeria bacterium]